MIWKKFFPAKVDAVFPAPILNEVMLNRPYKFQYENFIFSTQHDLFLLMEKSDGKIHGVKFAFGIFKYGMPNDEARGGHPLAKFGLGFYGMYQVSHSPWLRELQAINACHHKHDAKMFSSKQHYVVCFKDVTLEVICKEYEEIAISEIDFSLMTQREISYLE